MVFAQISASGENDMQNIKDYDTTILLDMLAQHTEQYTRMLRSNSKTGQFMDCERTVILIQYELAERKQQANRQ